MTAQEKIDASTKVSVIMPSYLGEYEGAAKDRPEKLERAIGSFLGNSHPSKELIVVADGCEQSYDIAASFDSKEVRPYIVEKQPLFSGLVRQKGLDVATGDIIVYLDSDDMHGTHHLASIVRQMNANSLDWCYFNDFIQTPGGTIPRSVELEHGSVGTSSIAHLRKLNASWDGCDGYGHDWEFIQRLQNESWNYDKIYGTMYVVCHVPNTVDY